MKRYFIPMVIFAIAILKATAVSNDDPVLMTINGKDVLQSEFEYLYNKNKLQQIQEPSFEEYLEMFIVYKLKVADAEAAGIDTTSTFRYEFGEYCKELAQPYIGKYDLTGDDIFCQLADKEPGFKNVMNEYREGLLLFEISNRTIWEPSANDKRGLETYFKTHSENYSWDKPHFKGFVISATDDSIARKANNLLNSIHPHTDSLSTVLREAFGKNVKVEKIITAKGENPIVDHLAFSGSQPTPNGKWCSWISYNAHIINAPTEAADVRGPVIADYQQHLEQIWIKRLREKYPVKLNVDAIRLLKK